MTLDLSYLFNRENVSEEAEVSYDDATIEVGTGVFPKKSSEPLLLTFFNDGGERIYMSGHSTATFTHPCDRCLTEVEISVPYEVSEEFRIADDAILCDEEEGIRCITDNRLDVDGLVASEIRMNWPAKVLCRPDCKGLCPVCGQNNNLVDCGCDTFVPDPRMMQALDVFNEFNQ